MNNINENLITSSFFEPFAQRCLGVAAKRLNDAQDKEDSVLERNSAVNLWHVAKSLDRLAGALRCDAEGSDLLFSSMASFNRMDGVRKLVIKRYGVDPEKAGGIWGNW